MKVAKHRKAVMLSRCFVYNTHSIRTVNVSHLKELLSSIISACIALRYNYNNILLAMSASRLKGESAHVEDLSRGQ